MDWTDKFDEFIRIISDMDLNTEGWNNTKNTDRSYYLDYESSKHIGSIPVMDFDFSSPVEFKKYIDMLWTEGNGEKMGSLKRFLIKCMMESEGRTDGILPEIDTYNYMM